MAAPPLSHVEAPDLRSASDRPRKTRAPRISSVQPPQGGVQGETRPVVLLAEDHEDSRDALRTLLDAFGYRVVEATNGREAVQRALAESPDIILMDMMMPRVDGLQATREIRAVPSLREVPIIALTAMEGARERVLDAGCDDLVPKPIDVRSFLSKIREWLETGRHAA
jgi:CheY-like chemotaxis protein